MRTILFTSLLALALLCNDVKGQWVQNGPDSKLEQIKVENGLIFGLGINRLFYSNSNGVEFNAVPGSTTSIVNDVTYFLGLYFVGTDNGLFRIDTIGAQWLHVTQGLSASANFRVNQVVSHDGILYVATDLGVYNSLDTGTTWNQISSLTTSKWLHFSGSTIYLACQGGPYKSVDNGLNWIPINNGLTSQTSPKKIIKYGSRLFTQQGSSRHVFMSTDDGNIWVNTTSILGGVGVTFQPLDIVNGELWYRNVNIASYAIQTYELDSNNWTWQVSSFNSTPSIGNITLINFLNGRLFGICSDFTFYGDRFFYSDDSGQNWIQSTGIYSFPCEKNKTSNNGLTASSGLLGSYSQGQWHYFVPFVSTNDVTSSYVGTVIDLTKIYAGTGQGVYFSSDSGLTWVSYQNGLPADQFNDRHVYDLEVYGDTIVCGTQDGIRVSFNHGTSFNLATGSPGGGISDFEEYGGYLYAGAAQGLYRSSDHGATWTQIPGINQVHSVCFALHRIFAETSTSLYMADTANFTWVLAGSGSVGGGWGGPSQAWAGPRMVAYDTLLFSVEASFGVGKMNVNSPGNWTWTNMNAGLPIGLGSVDPYDHYVGSQLAVFDNKLWLGTRGMSTFYRPLSDFGYPPVIVTNTETKATPKQSCYIVPNPTQNTLRIYGNKGFYTYSIISLEGKMLTQGNAFENAIDVSTLASGVYLLQVNEGGTIHTLRFVKE